jgi:hypothetical protein
LSPGFCADQSLSATIRTNRAQRGPIPTAGLGIPFPSLAGPRAFALNPRGPKLAYPLGHRASVLRPDEAQETSEFARRKKVPSLFNCVPYAKSPDKRSLQASGSFAPKRSTAKRAFCQAIKPIPISGSAPGNVEFFRTLDERKPKLIPQSDSGFLDRFNRAAVSLGLA